MKKEIEPVTKNLPTTTTKSTEPNGFKGKFYQIFKEKLRTILLKLLKKTGGDNTLTFILQDQHYPDIKAR